jgi:hypothetical protein
LVLPGVAGLFDSGWSVFTWANLHPGVLLSNTFLGLITYGLLSLLDRITFKVARREVELSEGFA